MIYPFIRSFFIYLWEQQKWGLSDRLCLKSQAHSEFQFWGLVEVESEQSAAAVSHPALTWVYFKLWSWGRLLSWCVGGRRFDRSPTIFFYFIFHYYRANSRISVGISKILCEKTVAAKIYAFLWWIRIYISFVTIALLS